MSTDSHLGGRDCESEGVGCEWCGWEGGWVRGGRCEGGKEGDERMCVCGEAFLMGSLCYDFPCKVQVWLAGLLCSMKLLQLIIPT